MKIDKKEESDNDEIATSKENSLFKFRCCIAHETPTDIYGIAFNHTIVTEWPVFATVGDKQIILYECNDKKGIEVLQVYVDPDKTESFFSVAWLFDRETREHIVAAAGERGIIRLVQITKANTIGSLVGHGHSVNDLRAHPREHMILIAACKDYSIYIWNAKKKELIGALGGIQGHRDEVLSVDFDLSCQKIVSSGMDHAVKVWHVKDNEGKLENAIDNSINTRKDIRKPSRVYFPTASSRDLHTNYVDCVRWCGEFIISKSCENELRIWKFGDRKTLTNLCKESLKVESEVALLATLPLPNTDVWFIKFAIDPKKKLLAAGNMKGFIYVWRLDSPDTLNSGPTILKHPKCKNTIRQLDFSRDGSILIGISDMGGIWRWDAKDL